MCCLASLQNYSTDSCTNSHDRIISLVAVDLDGLRHRGEGTIALDLAMSRMNLIQFSNINSWVPSPGYQSNQHT